MPWDNQDVTYYISKGRQQALKSCGGCYSKLLERGCHHSRPLHADFESVSAPSSLVEGYSSANIWCDGSWESLSSGIGGSIVTVEVAR